MSSEDEIRMKAEVRRARLLARSQSRMQVFGSMASEVLTAEDRGFSTENVSPSVVGSVDPVVDAQTSTIKKEDVPSSTIEANTPKIVSDIVPPPVHRIGNSNVSCDENIRSGSSCVSPKTVSSTQQVSPSTLAARIFGRTRKDRGLRCFQLGVVMASLCRSPLLAPLIGDTILYVFVALQIFRLVGQYLSTPKTASPASSSLEVGGPLQALISATRGGKVGILLKFVTFTSEAMSVAQDFGIYIVGFTAMYLLSGAGAVAFDHMRLISPEFDEAMKRLFIDHSSTPLRAAEL